MKNNTYLAADFGGGSGRIIAGTISKGKLHIEEIHRFTNRLVQLGKHIYWDFPCLFQDMKEGMRLAAKQGLKINGIGIDTWGVDFGLIDRNGNLLGNPISYRDKRTVGIPENVFDIISKSEHYRRTGIQVMPINTLFQLYSMLLEDCPQLTIADRLLFMPDLFNYFLTGVAANEYSISSTSEFLNANTHTWDVDLLSQLKIPLHLFGEIRQPGTILGKLKKEIAKETGLDEIDVITVGSHDTASAIAAIPASGENYAFLSSGTWSLLGTETTHPILTEEARIAQFTNEGGANGKITFLRNITGLWILQRLMLEWKQSGEEVDYSNIIEQAKLIKETVLIDVDAAIFQNPENMTNNIQKYCKERKLTIPQNKAAFVKCICASLASKYKEAIIEMNRLIPEPIKQLYIIGGGSRNSLLNQLTADVTGIPVIAGPAEATAIGNILTQAYAKGDIKSQEEITQIVRSSFDTKTYQPQ